MRNTWSGSLSKAKKGVHLRRAGRLTGTAAKVIAEPNEASLPLSLVTAGAKSSSDQEGQPEMKNVGLSHYLSPPVRL